MHRTRLPCEAKTIFAQHVLTLVLTLVVELLRTLTDVHEWSRDIGCVRINSDAERCLAHIAKLQLEGGDDSGFSAADGPPSCRLVQRECLDVLEPYFFCLGRDPLRGKTKSLGGRRSESDKELDVR